MAASACRTASRRAKETISRCSATEKFGGNLPATGGAGHSLQVTAAMIKKRTVRAKTRPLRTMLKLSAGQQVFPKRLAQHQRGSGFVGFAFFVPARVAKT